MAAAFPPFDWWAMVLIAPLPLVWAASLTGRPAGESQAPIRGITLALLVMLGVLPLWAYEMAWVIPISAAGYWPLIIALALFSSFFVAVTGAILRWAPALPLSLIVPIAWTATEFLRGDLVFHGFPWLFVCHPTIDAPWIPSTASLLGAYFTSFLVAAVAGAIADVVIARPRRPRAAAVALVAVAAAVALAHATRAGPRSPGDQFRVGVVQTNIPQDNKMDWSMEQRLRDFARFAELTRTAASADPPPDLIVWPETMFPGEVLDAESLEAQRANQVARRVTPPGGEPELVPVTIFADELVRLQTEIRIPMLVGAMATTNLRFSRHPEGGLTAAYDARYNSAFLIEDGRVNPVRYDKIDLTPFGEEMPYISLWPWLEAQLLAIGARGMEFDLSSGTRPVQFEIRTAPGRTVRFGAPICFEATRQALCRRLVNGTGATHADLLINLTNDGWFGWSDTARRQHLQIARWRSVELGVPMVRAANTGISAHIDGRGRLLATGVQGPNGTTGLAKVDGVLVADVTVGQGGTIFARVGNVFGWLNLAVLAFLVACTLRARRAARRSPALPRP